MLEIHPGVLGAVPGSGKVALVAVARPRKVRRKPRAMNNLLDSSAVQAHASRAELQTTLRQLERTRASLVAAPDAEVAVRMRIEALKTELYTRDPPCVQMSKLHSAIERAAKQVDAKKEALAKATAALAGAEDHYRDLLDRRRALAATEEEQDFYEENDYDMETDQVGQWWHADKLENSWQESWGQSYWKEDDRASPDLMQPSLEIDMLKSAIAEAQPTQHAFQQSIIAENAKFQQTVAGMLGKLWDKAQRAPSTPAGTGVPSTPNQDWSERKRQAVSGVNTVFPTFRVPEDEDDLTVQQLALQDQPPHL